MGRQHNSRRRSASHRWRCCSPFLVLALVLLAAGSVPAQPPPTEYQVKAAFLYNFAKFVEWPPEAFAKPTDPLRFCLLGEDPFGPDLKPAIEGEQIGGHSAQMVLIKDWRQARSCQLLFISASEKASTTTILDSLRGASVLTVGETQGFVQQGGMINFMLDRERVCFEVNLLAVKQAHLTISSRMLSVARRVLDQEGK